MIWFFENWYMVVVLVALLVLLGSVIFMFFKMPTSEQTKKVKEWLLLAVTEAEAELGSGTGQLKLRYVYDLFIMRFRWLSMLISFEQFSKLVDEALEEMRHLLKTNHAVKALVVGDDE